MIHSLKIWPEPFEETRLGAKRTEVRADGSGIGFARFNGGDVLHLQEWDPEKERYTGRELFVQVRRLTRLWETPPPWGLRAPGVAVMEIEILREQYDPSAWLGEKR